VKLLYCAHCGDIVRLFPEKRFCRCGKSWGHYLEDNATTVQTFPGLSLALFNPDFQLAIQTFNENPNQFSPFFAIRCWVNALSEPDVQFVAGESADETSEAPAEATPDKPAEEPDASGM
jgi:hypothetical protein